MQGRPAGTRFEQPRVLTRGACSETRIESGCQQPEIYPAPALDRTRLRPVVDMLRQLTDPGREGIDDRPG